MARREQREEASRRRRQEAEASQARLLSARLSETHTPQDLERMDTPSPLPSSPVGRLNRIEAMQAAQGIPLSPTVQIVNQGFDFSSASFGELSLESQSILDSLMPPPPPAPCTSSPAGVGVPARNVSQSPVPIVRGPVHARPTQGGKQPRRRPSPPRRGGDAGGGDNGDDSGGPSNGGGTPRSRRSGVPSDRGDLQYAFEQMSDRERARLRKKNVQSVKHTSTITTVYKDGRPPSVRRTSTRESPAPNQNSV